MKMYVLLFLSVVSVCGCSKGGDGEVNLDELYWMPREQTLMIEMPTEIAALELDLPYDPSKTISSSLDVTIPSSPDVSPVEDDGVCLKDGICLKWDNKERDKKIKVGILSAKENGFVNGELRLVLSYRLRDTDPKGRLFIEGKVVKALNTSFYGKAEQIECYWIEEGKESLGTNVCTPGS